MFKRPEFTREQEEWLCEIIGDWYIEWRHKLVDYDRRTHSLGFAKEKLKEKICEPIFECVGCGDVITNKNITELCRGACLMCCLKMRSELEKFLTNEGEIND